MSWNVTKAGPATEIAAEVRLALTQAASGASSAQKSVLEEIAQLVARVAEAKTTAVYTTKLLVETSGHVDSENAYGTVTFKSFA